MNSRSQHSSLLECLLDRHEPSTAERLLDGLIEQGVATTVFELLEELRDVSSKVASEAVWSLEEFRRRCGLQAVISWLDLGICLTGTRGALGLRYFKESPLILGVLEDSEQREGLLRLILELADGPSDVAPNCAYEFFKKAPELLLEIPLTELGAWAEVGMELAQWDYVLGVEFFTESPSIAKALSFDQVRPWIGFGMKLVTTNSLGKTDYVGTIEYFRSSPNILREIEPVEIKQLVLEMGSTLADESPELAIAFLADCPRLLQNLSSTDWKVRVFQYGLLLADRDAKSTLAYLNRVPEILYLTGESEDALHVFEEWYRHGMDVLEYSAEGARAYFSLETKHALTAVEQAMQGVPLRQIARTLKLFAQGMCGRDVAIEALPQTSQAVTTRVPGAPEPRAKVSADGQTIYLPLLMRQGATREGNMRRYTVMTAHEAGHLEFGTYRVSRERLHALARDVHQRYAPLQDETSASMPDTLGNVFALYPQKGVIHDLWEILEDARIEFLLQHEYPGLRQDLVVLTKEAVQTRSFLHGMTVREIVLDALLLRFANEPSGIAEQPDLQDVVERSWQLAQTILHLEATADDVVLVADRIYQVLDEMIAKLSSADKQEWRELDEEESSEVGAGPRAAEETSDEYRPITNLSYRGAMDPDMVQGQGQDEWTGQTAADEKREADSISPEHREESSQPSVSPGAREKERAFQSTGQPRQEYGQSPLEQWLDLDNSRRQGVSNVPQGAHEILYDEWDGILNDYRPRWCRVLERHGQEGHTEFVEDTLASYGHEIRLLRRYFETIRPTALRHLGRQEGGDDIDIDEVVRRIADKRVGNEPSDRVYLRRERHDRQVAVAFLIDMSGSTGQRIGSESRRVLDVEKEGLILLSEALSAIGDAYAMYGYSGQGRGHVELTVLKEFDEASLSRTVSRIGGIAPKKQNRDGAAIRHAVTRLLRQPARTRLLVILSDGKPLDDGYADEYALEDTRMALREARKKGIHPFCITVDREAGDYIARMYGEVGFLVIDDVTSLPRRLPRIYQRLTT
ncbi:MAG: VWA domain-containing protein [Nitrospirales bacterium]|nr:VWA domain-containing protein [Nitrospira sp.]MDR4501547.1 VWA domain-containing protein [Nitrospirales bacterium]